MRFGLLLLPGLRVGVGEQSEGAMEIVARVFAEDDFEVGYSGARVAKLQGADGPMVEDVGVVGAGGDGFVVCGSRQFKVMRVEIEVGEFLVVSGRGVVEDCAFQVVDALVPWNPAERQTGRCYIGTRFDDEINEGAEGPKEDDDVNPIGRRPPPYIVEDR